MFLLQLYQLYVYNFSNFNKIENAYLQNKFCSYPKTIPKEIDLIQIVFSIKT